MAQLINQQLSGKLCTGPGMFLGQGRDTTHSPNPHPQKKTEIGLLADFPIPLVKKLNRLKAKPTVDQKLKQLK